MVIDLSDEQCRQTRIATLFEIRNQVERDPRVGTETVAPGRR